MSMTNERAWKHEKDFVPSTIEQVLELQQRLVDEAGATQAKATGAVMWLLQKAHGTDTAAAQQRSDYRKLFAKLDDTTPRRPRGRRSVGAAGLVMTPGQLLEAAQEHGLYVVQGVPSARLGGSPIISDSVELAAVVPMRPIVHAAERAA